MMLEIYQICMTISDKQMNVVNSNMGNFDIHELFFTLGVDPYYDLQDKQITNFENKPILYVNDIGISWIADIEIIDNKLERAYILGPVFLDFSSLDNCVRNISSLEISALEKIKFTKAAKKLPVISVMNFLEFGIMMHYHLTSEVISINNFILGEKNTIDVEHENQLNEYHRSYKIEQKLLKYVETGNIHYLEEQKKIFPFIKNSVVPDIAFLEEIKKNVLIFITLCSRAAIKGGVAIESAYQLCEEFSNKLAKCISIASVEDLGNKMIETFISKVQEIKILSGVSSKILISCDYINLNIKKNISIEELAKRVGFKEYYFSKKFKDEMGITVKEYIMKQKINEACLLLESSNMTVQEISFILGFQSHSYFGSNFKKNIGVSPAVYRERIIKK